MYAFTCLLISNSETSFATNYSCVVGFLFFIHVRINSIVGTIKIMLCYCVSEDI